MCCSFPVLAYHKIDPRRELGINSISPQRFEKQIGFLGHARYVSISPKSLINNNINEDSSDRYVLITFDDGYEGIHNYAYPILKKHLSTAIIFVTTGYVGKYNDWDSSPGPRFRHLNWAHIKEMADNGICFGSHGVNHTFLTRQSDNKAKYEIEASKKSLEDKLGHQILFFSYPYGNYDRRIMRLVQEAGYKAAFSLRPNLLKVKHYNGCNSLYEFPRIAIYLLDNMWAFKAKIDYIHKGSLSHMQKIKNRLINKCAYASMLVEQIKPKRQIISDR